MTKKIIEILKKRNQTITFAESCTGGRVASAFTSISGASTVFNGSVVTYSNDIKSNWIGVKEETLVKYGAVSFECVSEMLDGVIKFANANGAIAISGIAGPDGGTKDKPVGTVYIGIKYLNKTIVNRYHFNGNREEVQKQATNRGIELFFKNL